MHLYFCFFLVFCFFRHFPLISADFDKIPKKNKKRKTHTHTSGKTSNPKGHDQATRSTRMRINTRGKRSNRNVRLLDSHVGCRIRPVDMGLVGRARKAFFPLLCNATINFLFVSLFIYLSVCLFIYLSKVCPAGGGSFPFRVVVVLVVLGYCI